MQFELDITKRLRSGGEEFLLRSRFSTTDRALVLFGPSGSGKTLTLRAIAGMLKPDEGYIKLNGNVVFDSAKGINVPTRDRNVGYVFQDYALFPHQTVRQNVGFGLKPLFGKLHPADAERVEELIQVFGLASVASKKPVALSGGQQQRTALARALATSPNLLLLDEPFSALDQPLRLRMRDELASALENFNIPLIMVTHDSDEVESFAETIVVYRDGSVTDVHSAREISDSGLSLTETLRKQVALAYQ
ncbi:ATP-binding cassette domain-containing protein [Pseudodesulfovibrio cashew]|uniref:ATP-binding cassette domain-containing protein n=1 Tax=Pseudodesulfovibrio cashew TaxID=2678688 RepID=A0A6I6JFA1_9BACT|nr:ATP-binding cassette domain-containing protein [Pseudodesulfovibrio cashew]QGY38667.1 ATP-binding cassette domain-containing protein [Pseudodesulfovibrio cashew]